MAYKTPGVYVQEVSTLPPSVAEVATAIPAFIGHTEAGPPDTEAPFTLRIGTLLEFQTAFGGARPEKFKVTPAADPAAPPLVERTAQTPPFSLFYTLSLYFRNGGGPCYVVSVGNYNSTPSKERFLAGLAALKAQDEPTLIVLTDAAALLKASDYYYVCADALSQCGELRNRFTIVDVKDGEWEEFRNDPSLSENLMYGAAYQPYLQTLIGYRYKEQEVQIVHAGSAAPANANTPASTSAPVSPSKPASGTWTFSLGGKNGLVVNFTGSPDSTPSVEVTVGTSGTEVGFAEDSGTLSLSNVDGRSANEVLTAWTGWKSTNKLSGFDLVRNGKGSDLVAKADIAKTPLMAAAATEAPSTPPSAPPNTASTTAPNTPNTTPATLASIKAGETALYNKVKAILDDQRVVLPPSGAVAGIYARTDREQGVWKAPANAGVLGVLGPVVKITNEVQDRLNVDDTGGKSINAIRVFTGKGTLVWGARTLAGNDNEWRYVSVRRLFITIEESTRKASGFAIFQPNNQSTWLKVKAMIESYLYGLWEEGALAGSKPEAAYFVHVGLGTTMTPQHVLEGTMIVEIGVAAVRPAEFIILRFSHKLQTA